MASQRLGSVDLALSHARRLLEKNADLAAQQAREILSVSPGHPLALLILGAAERRAGRPLAALEILDPLAREQTHSAAVYLELGVARSEAGRGLDALGALRRAVQLNPQSADGWRLLADGLDVHGDAAGADEARARFLKAATQDPRLREAAQALVENNLPLADARLRAHLDAHPRDVAALRMLAEVAGRLRQYPEAEELLERCVSLAPSFDAARHNYAVVLNRQMKWAKALPHVQELLAKEPRNPSYLNLKASILAYQGEYAASIEIYRGRAAGLSATAQSVDELRTRSEDCRAYRGERSGVPQGNRARTHPGRGVLESRQPQDLPLHPADVAALRAALRRPDLSVEDRLHFDFALGKALEDQGDYPGSFEHYAAGNTARRRLHPYDAEENARYIERAKELFTAEFFAARATGGTDAPDPIFIVGLPRAGSTLLEQILATHPQVEGTVELPDLPQIARDLAGSRETAGHSQFFAAVAALEPGQRRELGERYLATTRTHRKTSAPFFIDKMPNNCLYLGLIQMILPRAKIIDARRHPLGCCLSAFKQHFSRGQSFTYDLADLGRYYRGYVELMAHFDAVLPGRVHRVFHERVIEDTEGEVRRLLDYCGLPFEPECLRFYENERPVRTASSEQVRQPIFRDGMNRWRNFEPWLGPLKHALGDVLDRYPEVPRSF